MIFDGSISFLSIKFLLLMVVLLLLLRKIKNEKISRVVLLAGSLIFYSFFGFTAWIILISVSVFTWIFGVILKKLLDNGVKRAAKAWCMSFAGLQVAVLIFFKYTGMISMPAGISFYMLQAISFLVDIYREDLNYIPPLSDTMLYIGFFPQVISGPIVKSKDFFPKLYHRENTTRERLERGIEMFALGAFMKLVIADRLAISVDSVYSAPLAYSGPSLFLTSIAYSMQIFFDFAAYSYMATAAACLVGIDLDKNFNLPYLSMNPSEFWRRWHISLSTWLRDYVYIPLGGSRSGEPRTYLNIMVVMLVSGFWHGSTINFIIWGALHGLAQIIYRLVSTGAISGRISGSASRIPAMILTFLYVNFLWVFFRAPDLNDALTILTRIFTFSKGIRYYYVYTFIFAGILLLIQCCAGRFSHRNDPFKPLPLNSFHGKFLFCLLCLLILMFAYFGNGAFIYSAF